VTGSTVAGVAPEQADGRALDRSRVSAPLLAVALPGLVTLLALLPVPSVLPAVLYLAVISTIALVGSTTSGLLASCVSFAAFAFFFVVPRHTVAAPDWPHASELAGFVVVAVGLTQVFDWERRLRAAERAARRRAEEAAARTRRLEAVARALAEARTPQQVLDAVLTEGLVAADARAGVIAFVSPDGSGLDVVASRGYEGGEAHFDDWSHFGLDEELPLSVAVRTGVPVYLSSTAERNARFPLLAARVGASSEPSHGLTCLPLTFEDRVLGGLVLSFPGDEGFDADRRALKEALAAQAAQALDRARLDAAERELRERLAFLAEASELLASSLDYELTLARLAQLVVPRLADWCTVDMLAADGSIERLAVAHQDPAKVRLARELAERFPADRSADRGVARVLRTGEPELIPEIADELLVTAVAGNDELLGILRELGLRSALTVPLVARGQTLGALTLIAAESVRPYGESDLELVLDLARRAAVAVDNARLHAQAERRADAARALEHVTESVVLVDEAGEARYWNASAAQLLGAGVAEWSRLRTLLDHRSASVQTVPVELEGGELWLQVSRTAFDGGCVYAIRDVTEERQLERTRSEFVATASHELRTPIAAVYGAFQTLLRDDVSLPDDQRDRFLRMGLEESSRLATIVDDLLLVGQLDAGTPRITRERCELSELVTELAERMQVPDTHRLVVDLSTGLPPVRCDPVRLQQVLVNLIENALKYSPGGGTVTFSGSATDGTVAIEVTDEGIGIPVADQARIFERFVRLDPTLTRGVGGTGLGLYISRELVARMDGSIQVRSREGEGTTFRVELPAA
jgi:signal transduction histidine kinase